MPQQPQHALSSKPVNVIAVSAGKGGVGKSNVSINLSVDLAQQGKKMKEWPFKPYPGGNTSFFLERLVANTANSHLEQKFT